MEPVAFPFDFDDLGVVDEPIEDGGGGGNVADEFIPLLDGAVGGHQGGFEP